MPKSSRARRRSHRAPPAHQATRPLELALWRAQAARDLAKPLASAIEGFFDLDERLAERRDFDRWCLAGDLFELVAGWASLAAGRDGEDRAGRLLVSGLIGSPDPDFLGWVLEEAELGPAVRRAAAEGRRLVAGLEPAPLDGSEAASAEHFRERLDELRRALLRGGSTSETGELAAAATRELAEHRLALCLRAPEGRALDNGSATLLACVAGMLLGVRPALAGEAFTTIADEMFAEIGEGALERRPQYRDADPRRFFDAFDEFDGGDAEDEDEDGAADLDESGEVPVRALLQRVDRTLRFVDDPLAATRLAFLVASSLSMGAAVRLEDAPIEDLAPRMAAATVVAAATLADLDPATADEVDVPDLDDGVILAQMRSACAVLESDLDLSGAAGGPEDAMRDLDGLVAGLAEAELTFDEAMLEGLGWAGAATVAARLAVELSSGDPGLQRSLAPLLAVLDPLALAAAYPDLRQTAAAFLRAQLS